MSPRDWITLAAGFLVSAVVVLATGLPMLARYMPAETIHERNAMADQALTVPFGLLMTAGMFCLAEPHGFRDALLAALSTASISFAGIWRLQRKQPRREHGSFKELGE